MSKSQAVEHGPDRHPVVFPVSAALVVIFVLMTLLFREAAAQLFGELRVHVTTRFDWVFMGALNLFVLALLALVISPLGKIRLGSPDERPAYGYPAWLAMLFAAGVGIGLMFFGVVEPVTHSLNPPLGIDPENVPLARSAGMAGSIFHWGLHAWGCYVIVGLALAFFAYNRGLPLAIRSAFIPLFGDAARGWLGNIIDVVAVLATLFGLATSLGYGADQIGAGLNEVFGVAPGNLTRVMVITAIMAVAMASVLAGLDRGIKRLSAVNMAMAAALMIFVLVSGPTSAIVNTLGNSMVDYLKFAPALSTWSGREDAFLHDWTTFYWAWWIAWSPFVGMFMARVSRGRTVREFITWALLIPWLICIVWMSVFGGAAQHLLFVDGVTELATAAPELALYTLLAELPWYAVTSVVSIILIAIFFITSADSGALVIDTLAAGGKTRTPVAQRMFWCVMAGLAALALLLGGGHGSLQALCLSAGLPFVAVLLVLCFSLVRGLLQEHRQH